MKLDPFYLIIDRAAWIDRLGPSGLRFAQLRIKRADPGIVRGEIRAAKAAAARHGVTLVINDHWQLAIEERCDWLHLGQEDLAAADLDRIRAAGLKFGLSSHDDSELQTALDADPDYIALGPVFPTTAKQVPFAPQGLERLRTWKERIGQIPLVAIGGLTPVRAVQALEHGADSAAVITDVTGNADPVARTREWVEATETWR
ncbi:MAG: thiamine phosphate synthase [Roseibium sp.]|nr:thiamine phosphate synthase [Roseibium sp.]